MKFLHSDVAAGKNKLYNLLKVYALLLDSELGYCQGMNMVAAVILMNVPNEVLACQIFTKLLEKDNLAQIYLPSTPKLFEFARNLQKKIAETDEELFQVFKNDDGPYLEIALVGPLMTLFSNIVPLSEATQILSCFILDGEPFLMDLFMSIFVKMKPEILKRAEDGFELSTYLSK